MRFEEFIGGSYQSVSPNADVSSSVNLLLEVNESPSAKNKRMLIGRPGLEPFITLPTAPVRGLAAGEDRLFAATDSRLYEIDVAGIVTEKGIIATDAAKSPVQMFLNGRQLFVISAGAAYVHDGVNLVRCIDGGTSTKEGNAAVQRYKVGVVNTSGTAVTHASGDLFDSTTHAAGKWIYIAGVPYAIATYNTSTSLTLASSAGTLSAAVYYSGSLLTRVSGDSFDSVTHAAGNLVMLEGTLYEISLYLGSTQIVLKQDSGLSTGNWQSLTATPTVTKSGTVNVSGNSVTYASGSQFDAVTHAAGNQIVIEGIWYTISAYNSTTSLTLYTSAGSQTGADYVSYQFLSALTGGYLNGYFLAQQPSTAADGSDGRQVRISGLLDGSSWDSLDFVSKEGRPDSIRSILVDNLECYMLGRESIEVWRATDGESILARDPGAFADMGSLCRWAPVSLAGAVYFITGDVRGQLAAVRMRGFAPERISTAAVESAWQGYVTAGYGITDAIGFPYIENGHSFWVVNFPAADKTWVFDAGTNLWHEWAWFDGNNFRRHRGRCHAAVWGRHFQGDWETGTVYRTGFTLFRDNPNSIRYRRTAPHLHDGEDGDVFYAQFQLDMDTGTAQQGTVNTSGTAVTHVSGDIFDAVAQAAGKPIVIAGVEYIIATYNSITSVTLTTSAGAQTGAAFSVEPQMMLDWSDNDGRTWSTAQAAGAGAYQQDTKRVIWRRLGSGRDRVFRVTVDAKARQAWTAAFVKIRGEK